jgi:formate/nitrite transporter FocA (FNT family)
VDKENKILLPSGEEVDINENNEVLRHTEKRQEDRNYVPVIIKRNDESIRHPYDTLVKSIHEGAKQHNRTKSSLFLSAMAAGLILGFAAMSVAIVSQIIPNTVDPMIERFAMALVYPLGFIICIMSGTQLFTEQTATAVFPVLDRKESVKSLLILWVVVLVGNLFGTLCSSLLISLAEGVIQAKEGFVYVANHITSFSSIEIFISAILAGWLMAQGGWLILATSPGTSQLLCIYIVTFIIGLGGLHHSIAGSAEVFSGMFYSDSITMSMCLKFLSSSILGNLIGGSFFVATLNYAHIKHAQIN